MLFLVWTGEIRRFENGSGNEISQSRQYFLREDFGAFSVRSSLSCTIQFNFILFKHSKIHQKYIQ